MLSETNGWGPEAMTIYSSWGSPPMCLLIIRELRAQPWLCPRSGAAHGCATQGAVWEAVADGIAVCSCFPHALAKEIPLTCPSLACSKQHLGRGRGTAAETKVSGVFMDRAEWWTQQSHRGGSPPFTVAHDQGKLFEGEYVMTLSFQVRQCTVGQVGP